MALTSDEPVIPAVDIECHFEKRTDQARAPHHSSIRLLIAFYRRFRVCSKDIFLAMRSWARGVSGIGSFDASGHSEIRFSNPLLAAHFAALDAFNGLAAVPAPLLCIDLLFRVSKTALTKPLFGMDLRSNTIKFANSFCGRKDNPKII